MKTKQWLKGESVETTRRLTKKNDTRSIAEHVRTAFAARLLTLVLLLTLPVAVQAQFTFATNNGALTVTGYTGPGGDVTIPDTTNGLSVTSIGDQAFYNNTGLGSVIIPSSVTNIGVQAFNSCTSLTNVIIGNGLISIGDSAFIYCFSLSTVIIPNSVTSIGSYAFYRCTSLNSFAVPDSVTSVGIWAFGYCFGLTNVIIANSVTNIGFAAFNNCTGLTAIAVDTLNPIYNSVDGVLFAEEQTTLVRYPEARAGYYIITNSVTRIGPAAFAACGSLTNVTIPDSVTNIGKSAFYDCTMLNTAVIPNGVLTIGDSAFNSCGLTNVVIPNTVTSIGMYAFEYCSGLTSVTIANSVTNIGSYAFYDDGKLTGVFFRGDAPQIGAFVFYNKTTVYYLPGTTGWRPTFGGRPTALWVLPYPLILDFEPNFGVRSNRFGFVISWATNVSVAVEASTNLGDLGWLPLQTNALTDGSYYFSDPQWTNHPGRFYRLRWP